MSATDSLKMLVDQSKEYLETKIELTKLKTIDKSADVLSTIVAMFSMILVGFLLILFICVALALYLGKMLGDYYYGFLIMGGFFALLLLIIYVQRKRWIKNPIANGLINKMLN